MQADGGGWETINLTLTAGPLRNCIEAARLGICVCLCVGGREIEICSVIVCNKCLCHGVKYVVDMCHWCADIYVYLCVHKCAQAENTRLF